MCVHKADSCTLKEISSPVQNCMNSYTMLFPMKIYGFTKSERR
ncbi:hypothetical protein HMPREF3212_02254 [Citrobacter freundii]|nr:hypothetical protein HMPREF3212_02254 [Citrobacter freundii]